MKYIYLIDNKVQEVIPEINPIFPNIPIEQRYTAEFLSKCIIVADEVEVEQNYIYDEESKTFKPEQIEQTGA